MSLVISLEKTLQQTIKIYYMQYYWSTVQIVFVTCFQIVVVPRSTTSTTMYKTHSTTTTLVGEESPSKMLVQDAIKRGIKAETGII